MNPREELGGLDETEIDIFYERTKELEVERVKYPKKYYWDQRSRTPEEQQALNGGLWEW